MDKAKIFTLFLLIILTTAFSSIEASPDTTNPYLTNLTKNHNLVVEKTFNDFTTSWYHKPDLTKQEYIISIQNHIGERDTNVTMFISETGFNIDKVSNILFQEYKDVEKEIPKYDDIIESCCNYTKEHNDVNGTWSEQILNCSINQSICNSLNGTMENRVVRIQNGTETVKKLGWKNCKMQTLSQTDKEIKEGYGDMRIPLYGSKDKGTGTYNGTKIFKLTFDIPITDMGNGWGSSGRVALDLDGYEHCPYWNVSYDIRLKMPINNTAGAGVQTDFQVGTNISAYSANASSLRCYNRTTGNIIAHWNETVNAGNVEELWTNNTVIASGWDNNTFCAWQTTPTASSSSDGVTTFLQYHGSASAEFFDSEIVPYNNIIFEAKAKTTSSPFNVRWGLTTNSLSTPLDGMMIQTYSPDNLRYLQVYNGAAPTTQSEVPKFVLNQWYALKIVRTPTTIDGYVDLNQIGGTTTTNLPNEDMGLFMRVQEGTCTQEWSFARKYNATPSVYEDLELEYYVPSLYYNITPVLNTIYSSPHEYALNLTSTGKTNTNDTAVSTGLSEIVVTNYNNSASTVRNFTISGDPLDWYQAANLSGSYSMINSSGTIQTVADGNFTVNLVAGDYWIEQAGISIILLSQTPSIIYTNSTEFLNISYGIAHNHLGLNNTSVSFIYRNYDWDLSDSNHSIRPPTNDLASVWNFNGRILRAANRNESLNFENNATITGGDTYTWSGLDENSTKLTIVPVNDTYTKVYINATIHCIMPQMWYLDRTDQQEATKTQLPIHKTQNVLLKFWNFEIFKGNYDFLGVGYTDTSLSSNPVLWPSDANPVNFYYVNSSYDPATGGDPITSGYAVYMGSLNASGWVDHVYSRSNSNYVRGFIDNNYLHTIIDTTNISYLYFTSNTESSKPYYINMTNVASSTNVSFANTNTLWAGGSYPLSSQLYTPNIWFAFMKLNMSLDHKLYAADNNDLWGNSTMNRTNITQALFPPTTPLIDHFHFLGETDYDMDGVYYGNFSIGCGVSTDPDGGDVTHNLTLHYDNKTFVAIINNTFTDKDITHNGVYFDANFSSIPYYSQTDNYTLRLIATDDESESVTVWLGVNFSLDGSPRIISYSPETPVSSAEGENQTFSITTNLLGNVTWYLDSVEVFNETNVNSSSYLNNNAFLGLHNITVITTNTNGTNSQKWDWNVRTELWSFVEDSVAWAISVAQYLVSSIGIVIVTAFSILCILILMMLIGAALSVTRIIYR